MTTQDQTQNLTIRELQCVVEDLKKKLSFATEAKDKLYVRTQALEKRLAATRSNWGEEVAAKDEHIAQLAADRDRHLNAWYAMREENRKLRRVIKDLKSGDKRRDPDQEFVEGISAGGSFTVASAHLFLDAMRNAGYTYEPISNVAQTGGELLVCEAVQERPVRLHAGGPQPGGFGLSTTESGRRDGRGVEVHRSAPLRADEGPEFLDDPVAEDVDNLGRRDVVGPIEVVVTPDPGGELDGVPYDDVVAWWQSLNC